MQGRRMIRYLATAALGLSAFAAVGAQSPAPSSAATFVEQAAVSDMFELQSSELAAIRAEAPERVFAATMNEDHQKALAELHRVIKPNWRATPIPARLDPGHQARIDRLRTLNGVMFSRQYRSDQIAAHEAAIALFARYAASGSDPALRAYAAKHLPTLRMHLRSAQALPPRR